MKSLKNIIRYSLFMQLLIIFLITGFLIFSVLAVSFKYVVSQNIKESFQPHVAYYVKSIISDIGVPPNITRAKEIVKEIPVEIKITGAGLDWQSFQISYDLNRQLKYISTDHPGVSFARKKHDVFIRVDSGEYHYLFKYDFMGEQTKHNFEGLMVLLVIILILITCYFAIKRIFRPINLIKDGAIQYSQGNFDHVISVRREDELGELTQRVNYMAQEIKKMLDSKQQLLLAISHELRTPLTRVKLSMEFIEEQRIKAKISDDIIEMESLINDLLESERLSSNYNSLNLSFESVDDIIIQLIPKYFSNESERIRVILGNTSQPISIDKIRIQLLLKNIINNALAYSDDEVTITTKIIHGSSNKSYYSIIIADSGIGIPNNVIENITEPFFRVDPSRHRDTGGHGLGLYLAKLIISAHYGDINFASIDGQGTTVTINLPLDSAIPKE